MQIAAANLLICLTITFAPRTARTRQLHPFWPAGNLLTRPGCSAGLGKFAGTGRSTPPGGCRATELWYPGAKIRPLLTVLQIMQPLLFRCGAGRPYKIPGTHKACRMGEAEKTPRGRKLMGVIMATVRTSPTRRPPLTC